MSIYHEQDTPLRTHPADEYLMVLEALGKCLGDRLVDWDTYQRRDTSLSRPGLRSEQIDVMVVCTAANETYQYHELAQLLAEKNLDQLAGVAICGLAESAPPVFRPVA